MNVLLAIHRAAAVCCIVIAIGQSEFVAAAEAPQPAVSDDLYEKAIDQLRNALNEGQGFIKVHAAEALLGLGYDNGVSRVFNNELKYHGGEPHYRIGIWRVLVRSNKDESIRDQYLTKLRDASLDSLDPDRITAAESLAKLQYKILDKDRSRFKAFAKDPAAPGVYFYRWLLAEGNDRDLPFLADLLDSSNAEVRGITAYAIRHLAKRLPPDVVVKLTTTADKEPESQYRVYLYLAAYVAARDDIQKAHFKKLLLPYARNGSKDEKYQTAAALAVRSTTDDIPLLTDLLADRDADVRVSAADAILRIARH